MLINTNEISIAPNYLETYKKVVDDITEFLNIKIVNKIEVGTSNQVWNVTFKGKDCIFTLGSGINTNYLSKYFDELGFSNPYKYKKALDIQNMFKKSHGDLIMPNIINAGTYKFKKYEFGYNLQEKSSGTLLHTIWPNLSNYKKQELMDILLDKLVEINSIQKIKHDFDATIWYQSKFISIMNIAKLIDVFDDKMYKNIEKAFNLIIKKAKPLNKYGLIHGDYFQKNIFVSKNIGEKYNIDYVIDWETAITDGHSGWDFTLSPWWVSGEGNVRNSLYISSVKYQAKRGLIFFDGDINSRLLLTELIWYVTAVTEFSILQRYERLDMRLEKIRHITDCIISDKEYFNE